MMAAAGGDSRRESDSDGGGGLVCLYYAYTAVADPPALAAAHRAFAEQHSLTGRVRISGEGINGTLGGNGAAVGAYRAFLTADARFAAVDFKTSPGGAAAFDGLLVRVVPEIVGLNSEDSTGCAGEYLSPQEWHEQHLAGGQGNDVVVLDVRNLYETQLGVFKGSVVPEIRSFRQFPKWVEANRDLFTGKRVDMCCTGGIRCETAAAALQAGAPGVGPVFKLRGGIHRYLERYGAEADCLFQGRNFVFDKRVVQPEAAVRAPFAVCEYCQRPWHLYAERNRCHMCRELALICGECEERVRRPGFGWVPAVFFCQAHAWLRNANARDVAASAENEQEELDAGDSLKGPRARNRRKTTRARIERLRDLSAAMQEAEDRSCHGLGESDEVSGTAETEAGPQYPLPALRIAMVCDFFHPSTGGVETHIYQLAQCLIARGHKVVVVTHGRRTRVGVRYLTQGLKVYYLPFQPFLDQAVLPTLFTLFPLLRSIFVRERINLVHGHSAFSVMAHDAILLARTMGLKTVFTDHSLFGFADVWGILTNKALKFALLDVQCAICVSYTSKANTMMRADLPAHKVFVIPNAVEPSAFRPQAARSARAMRTIIVVTRLVPRKGAGLLAALLPVACAEHPDIRFVIAGDGPQRTLIEESLERHQLQDRVQMLGFVPHSAVRDVLVQGAVFLNCSLTDAFCTAIIEAASCGLFVVSTAVGGIPEVLPADMVALIDTTVEALAAGLRQGLDAADRVSPWDHHDRVVRVYNWHAVSRRTETVYSEAIAAPSSGLRVWLGNLYACGPVAGKLFVVVVVLAHWLVALLDILVPVASIDPAPDFIRPQRVRQHEAAQRAGTTRCGPDPTSASTNRRGATRFTQL